MSGVERVYTYTANRSLPFTYYLSGAGEERSGIELHVSIYFWKERRKGSKVSVEFYTFFSFTCRRWNGLTLLEYELWIMRISILEIHVPKSNQINGITNVPIDWMAAPVHTLRGRQVINFLTG